MFSGSRPYGDLNVEEAKEYICKQKGTLSIPSNIPSQLSDQIKQCWSYNPENRPDFNSLDITIKLYMNSLKNDEFKDFRNEKSEADEKNIISGVEQTGDNEKSSISGVWYTQVNVQDTCENLDKDQNKYNEPEVHVDGIAMGSVSSLSPIVSNDFSPNL